MGMGVIDIVKQKHTCVEIARDRLGLKINKSGDRCVSLAPESHNPTALVIFDDFWYDFKLQTGGDVIDLLAYVKYEGDKGKAIRELGGELSEDWVQYTNALNGRIQRWHKQLRDKDREYLHSRKISDDTIRRIKIGYDDTADRLVIPFYKNPSRFDDDGDEVNRYVCYYITRDLSGKPNAAKYKKMELVECNENIPWGLDTMCRDKPLVITEGAFDALSFWQEGFKVLSPMGGSFTSHALKQVIDIARNSKDKGVRLMFDNDDAGRNFTSKLGMSLFKGRVEFSVGVFPDGVKDVSEYYTQGGNLEEIPLRDGIEFLATQIKTRDELKEFMYDAARFVSPLKIEELLYAVALANPAEFPENWIRVLRKEITRAPSEDKITKEIIERFSLIYSEKMDFHEYSCGVWHKRTPTFVKGYINDLYAHWATDGRINSALGVLKARINNDCLFNEERIVNFTNGILDLESGEFKEHDKAYMSTIQMDYPYDADAKCDRWIQFIDEVTGGDKEKGLLLQEVYGYALYPDNSLQKCFFLIGGGSNGKSVFLNLAEHVFGSANVSTIEMSGLVNDFQRIGLMHSMLNISTETSSKINGAESLFKQIVVGDAITACYKGKDFVTFKPRAKFIMSCNDYIQSRDTSDGFMRRIIFIGFNEKFEGSRCDPNLTDTLIKERAGILNWALEGYRRLVANKRFTETEDNLTHKEEFRRIANPVVGYIDSLAAGERDKYERSELYEDYRRWCEESGHNPLSRAKFTREFRKEATPAGGKRSIFREYSTCGVRGFERV